MKRFPEILAAAAAVVALSSSFALAAEPAKKDVPAPAPVTGPHAVHGMGMDAMAGPMAGSMMGPLAQLSPEKQAAAQKLMDEQRKIMFPLHQSVYAKYAELEALNAAGDGESSKAKAIIRDIADLNAKMLQADGKFRARMFKETGLRVPVMGHGMMGGMGMMGGKGCGMMGGGMGGMMKGGMMGGGMMGGHAGSMPGMMGGAPTTPDTDAATHNSQANQ
ncbi:MAG: periplasmic heavy metal sensor [Desulfovibrio sp.]|nr:periplasmic heavy metal sensor [Desulfovibrio sp.]